MTCPCCGGGMDRIWATTPERLVCLGCGHQETPSGLIIAAPLSSIADAVPERRASVA